MIPVMRPKLPTRAAVAPYLDRIDATRQYSNFGPLEREVRIRFAEHLGIGAEHVATAANATLGLAGAIAMSPAEAWTVPAFTFPATPAAVRLAARGLRFADVDAEDWWMRATDAEPGTGLLPVAPFGAPAEQRTWPNDTEVVVDAAASLGSTGGLDGLSPQHAVVFSLHATKVLGSGEGAVVVFGDPERATRFRSWTNFGFSGSRSAASLGINAKLSEVGSAYALAAVDAWATELAEWTAARHAMIAMADDVGMRTADASRDHVTPYLIVRFGMSDVTSRVERVLADHGVGTRRWWGVPCNRMPAFGAAPDDGTPVTDALAVGTLGLPLHRDLREQDVSVIRTALQEAAARILDR